MYRRSVVFIAVVTTIAISQIAFGASCLAAAPPPVYNWTGFYIGGNVGYGWGRSTDSSTPLPSTTAFGASPFAQGISPQGILGGVQLGYNYQSGAVVWGLEADFQGSDIKDTSTLNGLPNGAGVIIPAWNNVDNQHLTWFGTVRGRVGWLPANPWLIYVTGGLIYGKVKTDSLTTFTPTPPFTYSGSNSSVRTGWTVGGGVEWMFAPRWTAKLEGLYYELPGQDYVANPLAPNAPFQVGHSFNHLTGGIFRAGVNFHF